MAFDTFSSFFNQIGHYWMPYMLCSKNSDQLPEVNWLTNIFAVGKFDYCVMVRYQNLTRKPELFWAPWARAPLGPSQGMMYPLNPPLTGPGCMESSGRLVDCFWLPKHGEEKLLKSTHKAD